MEWINVNDRLPKGGDTYFSEDVLAWDDEIKQPIITYMTKYKHQWKSNITHWMPLPLEPSAGVVSNFAHELPKEPLTEALNKHNVMGRSELLLAFCKEYHQKFDFTRADDAQPLIDAFLSKQ